MPKSASHLLFPEETSDARHQARPVSAWRVTVAGGLVVARTANLPFAVAQGRALVMRGYVAWLRDDAGNCAEVRRRGDGFSVTSPTHVHWLDTARALLHENHSH